MFNRCVALRQVRRTSIWNRTHPLAFCITYRKDEAQLSSPVPLGAQIALLSSIWGTNVKLDDVYKIKLSSLAKRLRRRCWPSLRPKREGHPWHPPLPYNPAGLQIRLALLHPPPVSAAPHGRRPSWSMQVYVPPLTGELRGTCSEADLQSAGVTKCVALRQVRRTTKFLPI